ncbi:GSCFA family protein [Hyunsoonleella jejuensis]|uniref:GSCFA family protein n=1 Tax=Hyunsoonleella jejuensis TaxID=419940 RepID=A0A1H9L0I1_9FLAO|nr:GSCFA domain-containing protein [Hyunsoonleella jejuensis]SER04759.1 GSCFA family protein [Hyunsoonleella jejuensis]
MNLQTKIPLSKRADNLINYESNILLLGSCFSENIGKKFDYFKFKNVQNPFGILFHPNAIETLLSLAVNEKVYSESDIFYHNEQWHCFDAHSKLSNISKEHLLEDLNTQIRRTKTNIQKATHIIITCGTSWVYRLLEANSIVANCHKVPQKEFEKRLLSVEEVKQSLQNIVALISSVNSNAEIIFTVSPIRHLKDGFIENAQSKAHLVSAIHNVINTVKNLVCYFPSYEIMMDELRDYRFYAEDMIHPNQTAINYIWQQFKFVWICNTAYKIMDEVDSIQKGLHHKPFNPNSEANQSFIKKIEARKKALKLQFPHMVF